MNPLFSTIIFNESQSAIQTYTYQIEDSQDKHTVELSFSQLQNLDSLFYFALAKGLYLNRIEIKDIKLNSSDYFEPDFVKLHFHEIKPFRKTVSLIIKTCPQDCETIYANVKHIIKQLSYVFNHKSRCFHSE